MMEINKKNCRLWSMLGMRGTYGAAILDLAKEEERLVCLSADLCNTSGLDRFKATYPERYFSTGIAEQNMLGIAAGLAMDGFIPFASTFATFATMRAMDYLRSVVGYMGLNVKVAGLTGGLGMSFFGNTHYAIEDIALAREIPGMTILAPADGAEVIKCVNAAMRYEGPVYLRLSGIANLPVIYTEDYDFTIGKGVLLREGKDIGIIANGTMVKVGLDVAGELSEQGITASVVDMHTIKPLDTEIIDRLLKVKLLVTIEEHSIIGGLGSTVAEYISLKNEKPRLLRLGINDCFSEAGDYNYLLEQHGLNSDKIYKRVIECMKF
ncbi:MAG: transketolase C-terminal domain-containing protein [Peptococcaceae bacterium]|nr:transketolase C-terminal domain-containing protein [Peptococcaceae bacterium]